MEINHYFRFKINKYKKIIMYFYKIRNYWKILDLQLKRLIFFKDSCSLLQKTKEYSKNKILKDDYLMIFKSELNEFLYFLMYSEGVIPKSFTNCCLKYFESSKPTSALACAIFISSVSINIAALRIRTERINAFKVWPEIILILV